MMKERESKLVKQWDYKGKLCIIIFNKWTLSITTSLKDYYTGYVQSSLNKNYNDLDVKVHGGLTFENSLEHFNPDLKGFFYGFDTGHAFDNPKVQDLNYCIRECEQLAEQLIKLENK